MNTDFLKYFSGKSLENAKAAVVLLEASLAQGSWVKGASRKVPAALSKSNVAAKFAKNEMFPLENAFKPTDEDYRAGEEVYKAKQKISHQFWNVQHCIIFGQFQNVQLIDFAKLLAYCDEQSTFNYKKLVEYAQEYAKAFEDVAHAVAKLDATKPVPVFTKLGASPTVSAELERQGGAVAVNVCPMKFEERVRKNPKTGKIEYYKVAILLWPAGIKHSTSRYDRSATGNNQCQACGHAIKNPFNWVPLILTDKNGAEKSLWVGRDCAETLFGIKLTGELELA